MRVSTPILKIFAVDELYALKGNQFKDSKN